MSHTHKHTHTPKADTLAEKATRAKKDRKNKTWDIKESLQLVSLLSPTEIEGQIDR